MYECYFKILCYTDCLNQDYVYMPWAVYRGGGGHFDSLHCKAGGIGLFLVWMLSI